MLKLVRTPKPRKYGEAGEQRAFVKWMRLQHPGILFFSIPNGGFRNPSEVVELKRQGLLPGAVDIFIAQPNDDYAGLFIEFKFGDGKLSGAQKAFIIKARQAGYCCEVVYNWIAAKNLFINYLEGSII